MNTGTITITASIAGTTVSGSLTSTAEGETGASTSLTAAQSGTLSTRTSDTAGTLTLGAGHGITDGDVIDIYWTSGIAYGATVGTVAGTSVPFTGASGTALPVQDTSITAGPVVTIKINFDGDDLVQMAISSSQRSHLNFIDSGDASLATIEIAAASGIYAWDENGNVTRPITGNAVDEIKASTGSTTAANLEVKVLLDTVA